MSEAVTLICRINTLAVESERSEYQLQKPKKLSSTLLRERKLSVVTPVHPRSRLVAASCKPLSKGFIDDTIFTDSDLLRLKASVLRKTDVFEFDRVIGPSSSAQDSNKRLFECCIKKGSEELFNGKSTVVSLLGCSTNTGKEEAFKGQGGLMEQTAKSILGLLKLKKTHDNENDHRLEVSFTALIEGSIFDLAEEKTVTSFRKTNRSEPSVIHIRHEEEFRSLMYLVENNLRSHERKLEMRSKDVMHLVGKFMLKRNGKVLGEITLMRTCSILRMPKEDIGSLRHFVEGDEEYLENVSQNEFLKVLLNPKTLRPNFLHLVFFASCAPKLFEQSTLTLRVAEEFCGVAGRANYPADKENDSLSRNASYMKYSGCRESSLSVKKQSKTGESSRKMYNSNMKRNSDAMSIDKTAASREKELEKRNEELERRLEQLDAELIERQGATTQEKKLEFIEKEIEYRRKLKKYKDMVCRLEGMVKSRTYGVSPLKNSKVSTSDPYKQQFEQLFQENLMLRQENSVLREKIESVQGTSTRGSRSQAKLESELTKLTRQKTTLQHKVRAMELEIRDLISDEQRDIQRLNQRDHPTDESFQ